MHNKFQSSWKKKHDSTITIGMIGSTYGVGTTSTAISLSIFLANVCSHKVALIEYNSNKHFDYIRQAARLSMESTFFTVSKVDLYPSADDTIWIQLQQKQYDYVIVDYGVYSSNQENTFARNNFKFIIGSLCEWKRDFYKHCIETFSTSNKAVYYLVTLATSYDIRSYNKETGLSLYAIPCIYDPFLIVKEVVSFWSKFSL